MELPDDVLRLICEYARPCFKYFREYKRALRICAFQEWPALRDALQTKPEKVLPCIYAHEKAQTAWLQAYHEIPNDAEKIRTGYYRKKDEARRTFIEIVNVVKA